MVITAKQSNIEEEKLRYPQRHGSCQTIAHINKSIGLEYLQASKPFQEESSFYGTHEIDSETNVADHSTVNNKSYFEKSPVNTGPDSWELDEVNLVLARQSATML